MFTQLISKRVRRGFFQKLGECFSNFDARNKVLMGNMNVPAEGTAGGYGVPGVKENGKQNTEEYAEK